MKGLKLFSIFGIDIEVHWSMLLLFILVALNMALLLGEGLPEYSSAIHWLAAVATAILFVFSIIFHEMAHSLVARKFGITVKRISLFLFGGMAHTENWEKFFSPKSEFFISAVGPLSSIFLAGVFWSIAAFSQTIIPMPIILICGWLSTFNVILSVFNLFPIFPMDGGRIFRSFCWLMTKNLASATKITAYISTGLAILLPIGGFFWGGWFTALWMVIISFFILIPLAWGEYRAVQKNSRI